VAIIIALPISYLLTKDWLDDFAYKISLALWYFLAAGGIALLISWITVGMQALEHHV
jgi:hypothetical protein